MPNESRSQGLLKSSAANESPQPARVRPTNPLLAPTIRVCPECAGPLARNSGCLTCLTCGWGRCG